MNEPRRLLLDANATELEKSLLGSWGAEHPPEDARARTLAVLGLGTGALVGSAAVGGSVAPKAIATAGVSLLKWLGLGMLALGTTAATVAYVRSMPHPEAALTIAAPPLASPLPEALAAPTPRLDSASTPPAIEVERLPISRPVPKAAAPLDSARTTRRDEAESGSLGAQVATLDRARAALAGGDPKGALALVDAYEARFPRGAFGQEADVLRVEALVADGDTTGAGAAGSRFLDAHPTSPHAGHVRALLHAAP